MLDPRDLALVTLGIPSLILNVGLCLVWWQELGNGRQAVDWLHYVDAARRFVEGGLYEVSESYAFHYSPVVAPLFGLLAPMGEAGWRYLHLVALAFLPSRWMVAAGLLAWPFWVDVESGNVMIFIVLAATWALRGSSLAIGATLLLAVLVPRPLMIPLAVWLLWQHPEWRLRFAALFAIHAAAVVLSGWGAAWMADLLAAGRDVELAYNVGPSRWVGTAWLVVGVPLGVWLARKGWVGLAGLAVSPYLLPYYLLLGLVRDENPSAHRRSI